MQATSNIENVFMGGMIADWLRIVGNTGGMGRGMGGPHLYYRSGDPTWGEAR